MLAISKLYNGHKKISSIGTFTTTTREISMVNLSDGYKQAF